MGNRNYALDTKGAGTTTHQTQHGHVENTSINSPKAKTCGYYTILFRAICSLAAA